MNGQQRIQPAKNEEKLSTTRNCACGIGKFLCILYVYYMHGVIYGEPYTGTEDMGADATVVLRGDGRGIH